MAIKINGSTAIDDSKNFNIADITFADASVQTTSASTPTGIELLQTAGSLLNTITNPNAYSTSAGDQFGTATAYYGDLLAVGAPLEEFSFTSAGTVYVYNMSTGSLVHTLRHPNAYSTASNDKFGQVMCMNHKYLVVSAPDEGVSTTYVNLSGMIYVFDVQSGALLRYIPNPNAYGTPTNDDFGDRMALYENYLVVGAFSEDAVGGTESGAVYVFDLNTGTLLYTLTNPNAFSTSASDYFGVSVAVSNDYVVVGAYLEDNSGGPDVGMAYVFDVTTGTLIHSLTGYVMAGENFGISVGVVDNYVVVGATGRAFSGNSSSGAIYVFNASTGNLIQTIFNPNAYSTGAGDLFGACIVTPKYIIAGTPSEDDAGGATSGKVYVFDIVTGALLLTIDNPNAYSTSANDTFALGATLSAYGDYFVAGAYLEDDAGGASSGVVYRFALTDIYGLNSVEKITLSNGFEMSQNNPLFQQTSNINFKDTVLSSTLNNPNTFSTIADDNFGGSVAVSGSYAIVGAPREDDAFGNSSGKAYIYNVMTGALIYTLDNPNTAGDNNNHLFGTSVAMSGNNAIVGAPGINKAYVFNVTTGALIRTLTHPDGFGSYGYSVGISGNYIIVGAWETDGTSLQQTGKVYVYSVHDGNPRAILLSPNQTSLGEFGITVAISDKYAIIGAPNETDINNGGFAYVYDMSALQFRTLTNPNAFSTLNQDRFGTSVAISGNYAIVGAQGEDDAGGTGSGKAYIFNAATGVLIHTLDNPNAFSTTASDIFGTSVAISGNYAVVTATQEDDAGGNASSGKAYIFNVTTGALIDTLNNPTASGGGANDFFGQAVAISENYVIVGAQQEDDAGGANNSGKAYIFRAGTTSGLLIDRVLDLIPNA